VYTKVMCGFPLDQWVSLKLFGVGTNVYVVVGIMSVQLLSDYC
jgi:hypothetical protein